MGIVAAGPICWSWPGSGPAEDFGGAHPANNADQSEAIDLTRGVALRLEDLVDPPRLREIARVCLPFYRALAEKKEGVLDRLPSPSGCDDEPSMGMILWECDKDGLRSPMWTLLPEGCPRSACGANPM